MFKLPKFKKMCKNTYFCVFIALLSGLVIYNLYMNMDKFTSKPLLDNSQKQLVLFYSPDCGYCKQVLPVWNKFELDFNGKKGIEVSKINGHSYPDLCKQYRISGFPTILYIKNGNIMSEYKGNRTYQSFADFLGRLN